MGRLQWILVSAALVALSTPAGAITITLAADPALSSITSASGSQALSGVVQLELGALPVPASNTTFDVTGASLTASGGSSITLDDAVANPGLGVVNDAGSFLIPNLFVTIDDGSTETDLTVVDVTGSLTFGPGGASIESATTTFVIDGGALGDLTVTLVLIPEPSTFALALGGVAALGLAARARRRTVKR